MARRDQRGRAPRENLRRARGLRDRADRRADESRAPRSRALTLFTAFTARVGSRLASRARGVHRDRLTSRTGSFFLPRLLPRRAFARLVRCDRRRPGEAAPARHDALVLLSE